MTQSSTGHYPREISIESRRSYNIIDGYRFIRCMRHFFLAGAVTKSWNIKHPLGRHTVSGERPFAYLRAGSKQPVMTSPGILDKMMVFVERPGRVGLQGRIGGAAPAWRLASPRASVPGGGGAGRWLPNQSPEAGSRVGRWLRADPCTPFRRRR